MSGPIFVAFHLPKVGWMWISADRVLSAVDDVLNRIRQGPSLFFWEFHDFGASDLGQY